MFFVAAFPYLDKEIVNSVEGVMNGHKYQSRLNQKLEEGSVQDISSHFDRYRLLL